MRAYDFERALRVALLCASKDPLREPIGGVLIAEDRLEATDGHRLVRVRLPGKLKTTGFATRLDVKLYLKRLKLDSPARLYHDGFIGPAAEHLPLAPPLYYPETHRLWSMAEKAGPSPGDVWFNPRYLATLHRIGKRLGKDFVHACVVRLSGPTEPALFTIAHDELLVELLLMPMRQDQLKPGFACTDCGHPHQGERFAFICIGCPCERRQAADAKVVAMPEPREVPRG